MDLFAVDSWASDKTTDDLNTRLFGEIEVSHIGPGKDKDSQKDNIVAKKVAKRKKKKPKASNATAENDEEFSPYDNAKVRKKQVNNEVTQEMTLKEPHDSLGRRKEMKHKKGSAKAEVVETNWEENESPGFKGFLVIESDKESHGVGVLKKKRKTSSKKNKYKHLDEMRKAQRESAMCGESKLDIDVNAKLNSRVINDHRNEIKKANDESISPKKKKKLKAIDRKDNTKNSEDENLNGNKKMPGTSGQKHGETKLKSTKKRKLASGNNRDQTFDTEIPRKRKKTKKVTVNADKLENNKLNSENDDQAFDDNEVLSKKKKNKKAGAKTNTSGIENTKSSARPKTPKKSSFNTSHLREALMRENQDIETQKDSSVKDRRKGKKENTMTLREKMMEKLNAARFRFLNEKLYTIPGHEALELMQEDQTAFEAYHHGFQQQVNKWPQNPVERMITYIKKRPEHVVADFGCGDAKIAQAVNNKVYSFDLVALNKYVTPCDMANVPLDDESVDIAVFCLALMGTNLADFLAEAHRILKMGGNLLIAEVVSRFENTKKFMRKVERMGFTLLSESENKVFLWFELKKTAELRGTLPTLELAPCVYKKR